MITILITLTLISAALIYLIIENLKTLKEQAIEEGVVPMEINMDNKEGYAICFNEWSLDKDIKGELGLLLIISSLCAEKGFCYASNEYFTNLFEMDETTTSKKIKKLERKGYITIEYERRGTQIIGRKIRLAKMPTDHWRKCQRTIGENAKENNTSINNTSINKKEIYKEKAYAYGEYGHVTLTDKQRLELDKRYGDQDSKEMIDFLDNYCESTGKRYKNYYATFKSWVVEAYYKKHPRVKGETAPVYDTSNNNVYNEDEFQKIMRERNK